MKEVTGEEKIFYCEDIMYDVKILVSVGRKTYTFDPDTLEWERPYRDEGYPESNVKFLTLDQIVEKIGEDLVITVWQDTAMWGILYQYGNWGKKWYQIGDTCGFA